jgi:hypothetical protein
MSIYGPIFPAHLLSNALADTVKLWIEEYLRETERQNGIDYELPSFASYNKRPQTERWIEEQLPALIFVIPGLAEVPVKDGEGNYTAAFRVGAAIFNIGQDKDNTDTNSKMYAAVRAILLQQSGLGGLSDGISWEGENYDQGPTEAGRTLGTAVVDFIVRIPGVVNKNAGPNEPSDLDHVGSDWPVVEEADLIVDKEDTP